MPHIPEELMEIRKRVDAGERPNTSVRILLSWFWGSQRRGRFVTGVIRDALNSLDLATRPDFNHTYLDGVITFAGAQDLELNEPQEGVPPLTMLPDTSVNMAGVSVSPGSAASEFVSFESLASLDPTYRIERLGGFITAPIWISPDARTVEAVTIMLRHDFSQLPLMTTERDGKGIISWKSLGSRLAFGKSCEFARDAMERHSEISDDDSLFHAISLLQQHDCVLVRDSTRKIAGILTAYDISVHFDNWLKRFLFWERSRITSDC
jgi:CBS domain-containing protein